MSLTKYSQSKKNWQKTMMLFTGIKNFLIEIWQREKPWTERESWLKNMC